MNELEPNFPVEFVVPGTPVSHQSATARSREEWKTRVREYTLPILQEGHWATKANVAVTLFYFPPIAMQGDLDNIAKLVVDALKAHIYLDDRQVERLVLQKFEPGRVFEFRSPSKALASAIIGEKPLLYVCVSNGPREDLR